MTSRERVNAVLDGREPDRLPIDCGGTENTGIHGSAYNKLKEHLGLNGKVPRLYNLYMQVAKTEDEVRERFSADAIRVAFEATNWKLWKLPDGSPCEVPEGWNPIQMSDGGEALMGPTGEPPEENEVDKALRRLTELRCLLKESSEGYKLAVPSFRRVVNQKAVIAVADLMEIHVKTYARKGDVDMDTSD